MGLRSTGPPAASTLDKGPYCGRCDGEERVRRARRTACRASCEHRRHTASFNPVHTRGTEHFTGEPTNTLLTTPMRIRQKHPRPSCIAARGRGPSRGPQGRGHRTIGHTEKSTLNIIPPKTTNEGPGGHLQKKPDGTILASDCRG